MRHRCEHDVVHLGYGPANGVLKNVSNFEFFKKSPGTYASFVNGLYGNSRVIQMVEVFVVRK